MGVEYNDLCYNAEEIYKMVKSMKDDIKELLSYIKENDKRIEVLEKE